MGNTTHDKPGDPVAPHPKPETNLMAELVGFPRHLANFVRRLGVGEDQARRLVDGILASLGLGGSKVRPPSVTPTDAGTLLAQERTNLAMERTYWAAERTLMGWVRTALSMISFGFTIGKLGQVVEIEVRSLKGLRTVGAGTIAYMLVVLGTLALLAAAVQYACGYRSSVSRACGGSRALPSSSRCCWPCWVSVPSAPWC